MHHLKEPDELTGRRPKRDDAIRIAIVSRAQAAVEIRRCTTGGDEHEVACHINRHGRPGVGRASLAGRRWVPRPFDLAGLRVERANRTAIHFRAPAVADRGTDDDGGTSHDRRRRDLIVAIVGRRTECPLPHQLAALRIERDQPRIQRAEVHDPSGDSDAARGRFGVIAIARDMGIVAPLLATGCRIEGDHLIEGRDDVEQAPGEQRRGFKRRDLGRLLTWWRGLGLVAPRDLQLRRRFRRQVGCKRYESEKKEHVAILPHTRTVGWRRRLV